MQSPLYFITPLSLPFHSPLNNRQPDGFAFGFGFDNFLFQAVKPDATVNHLSYYLVFANENAPFVVSYTIKVAMCLPTSPLPLKR